MMKSARCLCVLADEKVVSATGFYCTVQYWQVWQVSEGEWRCTGR
ncbi:hypothetical protein Plhal304r1_c015g0055491 [Plasmopara halstedii]